MGMTLIQLMKKQPPYIISHAETVRVTQYARRVAPKTNMPAVIGHAVDFESANHGHNCQIVSVESPRLHSPSSVKAGWVKVSCACEFFKFSCEYALAQNGVANIRHSNGEPATFTNPSNYPLLCIAEGQMVRTSTGDVAIEKIKIGMKVATHNGLEKVLAVRKTGTDKNVVVVKAGNTELLCTPDHLVYAVTTWGQYGWFPARVLTSQHFLVSPNALTSDVQFPAVPYMLLYSFLSKTSTDPLDVLSRIFGDATPKLLEVTSAMIVQSYFNLLPKSFNAESLAWILNQSLLKVTSVDETTLLTDVFDIEVENAHCFYANGVLVHNCKHLFALGKRALR